VVDGGDNLHPRLERVAEILIRPRGPAGKPAGETAQGVVSG